MKAYLKLLYRLTSLLDNLKELLRLSYRIEAKAFKIKKEDIRTILIRLYYPLYNYIREEIFP